ncbi:hypothetical protein FE251_11225 [Georgenia wutianyii]|uniref:Uncharacterized protein n=1 Tax=Georgenia wutianyii TaxID=2585135 RepID=A0ABX5VPX9_9MICO|nr:hypothetical protein [Georgenia wutianyii]QDB79881.1 hypothetical protein FE251_11225 [Georgenia wutianyii]
MRRTTKLGMLGAGGVAAIALAGAALLPASGQPDTDDGAAKQEQTVHGNREDHLREALADLVEDGTLTQDAADAVAEALGEQDGPRDHGRGGGGGGGVSLDAAAEKLGLTAEELREELADGSTLADVAEEQGVGTAELVDALVAAATERLDEAVADGRLTQADADERAATLEEQITEAVEQGFAGHGGPRDGGPEGERPGDRDRSGDGPQGTTESPTVEDSSGGPRA